MSNIKFSFKGLLFAVFSLLMLLIYLRVYHQLFPSSGVKLILDEKEITQKANDILNDMGYTTVNFTHRAVLDINQLQIRYLQSKYGLKKAKEIIAENTIPVYFWKVRLRQPDSSNMLKISYGDEDKAKEEIKNALSDTININLTTDGRLIDLHIRLKADKISDTLSYKDAFLLATRFLEKYEIKNISDYQLIEPKEDPKYLKENYHFVWENSKQIYGEKETISVEVNGKYISKVSRTFKPPEEFSKKTDKFEFFLLLPVISFIAIIIFIIVLIIQKLRKDKIELKSSVPFGIIISLAWIFMIIGNTSSIGENFLLTVILPIGITTPFIFIGFVAVSGLGESEAREVWEDKLFTFDALRKGSLLFPRFSKSILRGFSLAFISLGVMAILLKLSSLLFSFSMDLSKTDNVFGSRSFFPMLYFLSVGILGPSFGEYIFRLFFVSTLRKRPLGISVIVIISAFIWIFSFGGYASLKLSSYPLTQLINLALGIILVLFFIKWDFLTVYWGALTYILIRELYPLTYLDQGFFMWNGLSLWLVLGIVFILAIVGLKKKVTEREIQRYVPDYIERQKERERIFRELEIARSVQLSFLPREKPKLKGIDIASICIPATEVGGDYYDFFEIDDHRLGVVIGDVSGKGISAAFHMTLTKGFLKSKAKSSLSPREVMIHLNELFYENVERGTFISMIYGIFDLEANKFTFSRAGHNPLLLKRGSLEMVEVLCPKGLALGLESGNIFNRFIEEYVVGIHSQDIFMLYTDGFSEAMNKNKQEFGEDRLHEILKRATTASAESIISEVKAQVYSFVGDASQHDDMTMLIVKIL